MALAQGNIAQELKWSPENLEESLRVYYQQVATTRADLMLLPETALPLFLDDLPSGYLSMMEARPSVPAWRWPPGCRAAPTTAAVI